MKKILILLVIIFLVTGCCMQTSKEEEPSVTENQEEVINASGEVFAKYEENFDEDINDTWLLSKYVTLEPSPQGVYFEDGTIKLVAEETDRVPILSSAPHEIDGAKYITLNIKMKTNFANEYYTGATGIFFTDSPDMKVEPDADNWSANFGKRAITVEYVNYFSDSSRRIIDNGFVFYTSSKEHGSNAQAFESAMFDEWFTQQIVINMETGEVTCTINDETLTGMIDIPEGKYIRIWVHPYGWYTGHEVVIDSIDMYFGK